MLRRTCFAPSSSKSGCACAAEFVDLVHACATIDTGITGTFINICQIRLAAAIHTSRLYNSSYSFGLEWIWQVKYTIHTLNWCRGRSRRVGWEGESREKRKERERRGAIGLKWHCKDERKSEWEGRAGIREPRGWKWYNMSFVRAQKERSKQNKKSQYCMIFYTRETRRYGSFHWKGWIIRKNTGSGTPTPGTEERGSNWQPFCNIFVWEKKKKKGKNWMREIQRSVWRKTGTRGTKFRTHVPSPHNLSMPHIPCPWGPYLPISHRGPVFPGMQLHVNLLIPLTHTPCTHGLLAHSSMSD